MKANSILAWVTAVLFAAVFVSMNVMALDAIYVNESSGVLYTPTTGDIAAGDVVVLDNVLVAVAVRGIPSNTLGELRVTGAFKMANGTNCAYATLGIPVYWNATGVVKGTALATGALSTNWADGPYCGYTMETGTTNMPSVRVALNAKPSTDWPWRIAKTGTNLFLKLPVVDPGVSSALWSSNGVVVVSP